MVRRPMLQPDAKFLLLEEIKQLKTFNSLIENDVITVGRTRKAGNWVEMAISNFGLFTNSTQP